jgi:hypothetical protein
MKKIVTILSLAGLFTSLGVSGVKADVKTKDVVFKGSVPQICTIEGADDGTFKVNIPSKPTQLITDKSGTVKVFCNNTGSNLNIGTPVPTNAFGQPVDANFDGGDGAYASAAGRNAKPNIIVNSATAKIKATIGNGIDPLEAGPNYEISIPVTLTP